MHDSPGPARQLALARKAARMVPGAFQPEPLIRFARLPLAVVSGDALLDAATVADRQREGGGAPSERRAPGEGGWRGWMGRLLGRASGER